MAMTKAGTEALDRADVKFRRARASWELCIETFGPTSDETRSAYDYLRGIQDGIAMLRVDIIGVEHEAVRRHSQLERQIQEWAAGYVADKSDVC
jgi:hypothetical protein